MGVFPPNIINMKQVSVIVIGAGMSGLTAAALMAQKGKEVLVLEKNWLPGGCTSSYPRKHYIFESGATTLVGLDEDMPLQYVLAQTGIKIPAQQLEIPMKVHLNNGKTLTRYQDLTDWIAEASRVFGPKNQKEFWEKCFDISRAVWKISLQQTSFPPSNWGDLVKMGLNFRPMQLKYARYAFISVQQMLQKYELDGNQEFVDFVNEQLLITAQNHCEEVNMLFGATALCYTQFGNYYVPGGLLNLVQPFCDYIQTKGGEIRLRTEVKSIKPLEKGYEVVTNTETYQCETVISAIPINNTLELWQDEKIRNKFTPKLMESPQLNSAFTMGIVAKRKQNFDCIHHQLHLSTPLPYTQSASIFVSISRHDDPLRCPADEVVMNISTHVHDPEHTIIDKKEVVETAIFDALEAHGLMKKEDLVFYHSSTPKSWMKWTSRKWGFVGGYPQYMSLKPWQMLDARLDHKGAFICGDSTYPGQGIPGACLSGIIAVEKALRG